VLTHYIKVSTQRRSDYRKDFKFSRIL